MDGNEYQIFAMRTNDGKCRDRLREATVYVSTCEVINACLGLSGEVGELNDMIKKRIFHDHELDELLIIKELGDIMWYIALMCEAFGISMDEVMQMNIDKLKARYPDGFDTKLSKNRKEGDA